MIILAIIFILFYLLLIAGALANGYKNNYLYSERWTFKECDLPYMYAKHLRAQGLKCIVHYNGIYIKDFKRR